MRGEIIFKLNIELDQTEHGNGDRDGFEASDPDVCIARIFGALTIPALCLGNDGNSGEERANKAILEDADPDHLDESALPFYMHVERTLNHVSPLRGLRSQPLSSPPEHFCIQVMGHTQFFGCTLLKYSFCSCRVGAM
jgi:hypothetical protein